jgi:hypothetical protein
LAEVCLLDWLAWHVRRRCSRRHRGAR